MKLTRPALLCQQKIMAYVEFEAWVVSPWLSGGNEEAPSKRRGN